MKGWEEIKRYFEQTNLDPHKLACGCAVKIDLERVVYPALQGIRERLASKGIVLTGREDADISLKRGELKFIRSVFHFDSPTLDTLRSFNPQRAITLTSVYRVRDPHELGARWLSFYEVLASEELKFTVGKGHTIEAYSKDDEFILFDFFKTEGDEADGYLVANNDTIQLIDPMIELGAQAQVDVALSNALNDLFALGAFENIKIYPVYAAPTEETQKKLQENIRRFCARYGFELVEQEPISNKTLLLGATVFGETKKQPPTFYDKLQAGDLILVHRPFGDLAPINLYLDGLIMGESFVRELGFTLEELEKAKDDVVNTMSAPNVKVGEIINRFCPHFGEVFDEEAHLKATGDLSGPGIQIFKEIAELGRVNIKLEEIPLRHEEIVRAATKQLIIPNGTSGTNGAIAIIASPTVIEKVEKELREAGYIPEIIGVVEGRGEGVLTVPESTKEFVADSALLARWKLN